MRRFIFCSLCLVVLAGFSPVYAQDKARDNPPVTGEAIKDSAEKIVDNTAEKAGEIGDDVQASTSSLVEDLKKARDIIMGSAGDNAFARGLIIALFQPMFLAAMFSLGLWAGQMSERFKHVWALPVVAFTAIFIGAFITAYHSEWKPEFGGEGHSKILSSLQSTEVVTVLVGLLVGGAVAARLILPPVLALLGAIAAGLILGFSQTTELGEHHNSLLPFWAGFGLTGLLVNIFGLGFETFLGSINLAMVTRWIGLATVALSFFFGMKIF
ncbi:MAG: hypothetical protein JWM96_581 [Alphaproteobacteria bacterium]|nr:hypothetical protein [Alphaproteobacteria bacterium]